MDISSSPTNSSGMDLLEKSMYDISGNDLLDIWDADIASAVSGLIRPPISNGHGDENDSVTNSLDGSGHMFTDSTPLASEHQGIPTAFSGDLRQENIIRNDKLLTEGENITHPDSSDSDYCTTSSSESTACNNNCRRNFTLNQNVHDSLLNSSSNYPPPPPMTCMAPLGSGGANHGIKGESVYLGGISKIETHENLLNDPVELHLSSSPTSSSWIGAGPSTSPSSPLLNALNNNINMLNSSSGMLPLCPSPNQRIFDGSITGQFNTDPHLNNRSISANDQMFNGMRSDQPGRTFQQGSDGDSLPESPMSSGHDDPDMGDYSFSTSCQSLQRIPSISDESHSNNSTISSSPQAITYEKQKTITRFRKIDASQVSWDPTSSLNMLMDDSSPPSSVTSSNYISRSIDEATTSEDKDLSENSWVSSTTKVGRHCINDIKRELEVVNSSRLDLNDYNAHRLVNGDMFDEEESLEELDEDETRNNSPIDQFDQISNLDQNMKPNRIYITKSTKPNSRSSVNKLLSLNGRIISSVKSESAQLSSITYSRPSFNGIEFSSGSSARTILKLPNPSCARRNASNGTLAVHQPSRTVNGTLLEKAAVVPPTTVKPNIEAAAHFKRGASKSIICHSKGNPSNPQWLSSNNTNIKIRSPMAVGNTTPTKTFSSNKRALEETPKHYEINPGVSTSNVVITDGKIIYNKNGSPPSAKKPTPCSDSVTSSSSVAYVGGPSIQPKLPLPSLSSILRYAYQVNPYASSSNDTSAGRSINQESAYTQPNGVFTQTTASSQKYIPSLSNNVTSRVVFNGNINSTTNSRQNNGGKSTSFAANHIVAAAASAAGLSSMGLGSNQNGSHVTRGIVNGGRYLQTSATATRQPIQTSLISSQPKGATGVLNLTEEEKRTLISEGYPVPQRLPLSKSEEKSLKKIRRKIKNKISAQESRRKKKEYMDTLEKKMDRLACEVDTFRQKSIDLENKNASLVAQVKSLESQLAIGSTSSSLPDE